MQITWGSPDGKQHLSKRSPNGWRTNAAIPHRLFSGVQPQSRSCFTPKSNLIAQPVGSTDTEMMSLFLEQVSRTFANSFLMMQVDQAGWHGSKDLKIPANRRLLPQPAYSPEVNPVEPVWEDLREKHLANLALTSLDEVIDNVCEGLNQLEADPDYLRSMTYFPHFRNSG